MSNLEAQVVAYVPERERFAELAAAWFVRARRELVPEYDLALEQEPAGAHGTLRVRRQPTLLGDRDTSYTEDSWQQMLAGLDRVYPFHAELIMGMPYDWDTKATAFRAATVGVHRNHSEPEWTTFAAGAQIGSLGDTEGEAGTPFPGQDRWAEFVKEWVTRTDACYAHVTDDADVHGGTALEQATPHVHDDSGQVRGPESSIPRCREVLRGYSWVTVCAPELAARLGGAAALAASGAFAEVTELPHGQVFLRATPAIEDYHGAAVRRVFEVLAPVLLTGRPHPMMPIMSRARLVPDADAADYR
jgi:hypothetical protein